MNTRDTLMLNPFDGALFAGGGAATFILALATGSAVPAAIVTGFFMLLCKLVELWWKSRTDRRVQELEKQLTALKSK